jgi:two-component system LytT family response regulator
MTTPLRVLIVDDEPLGRRGIRARLNRAGGVEVVGECASGREAVEALRRLADAGAPADLVFLDVQMPELDGFGVVEAVGREAMPVTVFVTAYDEHALRAFEAAALDYLLKPIRDDRFEQALERARRRVSERGESALGRSVASVLREADRRRPEAPAGAAPDARFLAERGGRVLVVHADAIDWVEAAGDYVQLHAGRNVHLLRETMARMEERLDSHRFVRIHRSSIVNVERVRELRPLANRDYAVVLESGTELRLSRSYRKRFSDVFGADL